MHNIYLRWKAFFLFAALKCAHSETISVTCQNANFTYKIPYGVQFVVFYYMQCFIQKQGQDSVWQLNNNDINLAKMC